MNHADFFFQSLSIQHIAILFTLKPFMLYKKSVALPTVQYLIGSDKNILKLLCQQKQILCNKHNWKQFKTDSAWGLDFNI